MFVEELGLGVYLRQRKLRLPSQVIEGCLGLTSLLHSMQLSFCSKFSNKNKIKDKPCLKNI